MLSSTQSNGRLRFAYRVATDETCLLFYKIPQIGGAARSPVWTRVDALANSDAPSPPLLGMLTIDGGLVKSIYDSMVRVYLPQGTLVIYKWMKNYKKCCVK